MEDLLVKVLMVIDRNMEKKLNKLRLLIEKNRLQFDQLKFDKQQLQTRVMDLYCKEDSEVSISEQIGFIFRVAENNAHQESLLDLDLNRLMDKTSPSFNVLSVKNIGLPIPPEYREQLLGGRMRWRV